MSEKTIIMKRLVIGTLDNNPVTLTLVVKEVDLTSEKRFKTTINHEKVDKYKTISITGQARHCFGQILSVFDDPLFIPCLPIKQLMSIKRVWELYHLNDLNPNCCHQNSFNCNLPNYEKLSLKETKKCPQRYKYGSEWLVKVIPDPVILKILSLFEVEL
jgi:hypothetical protein